MVAKLAAKSILRVIKEYLTGTKRPFVVLLFDFDGTLSTIVKKPDRAEIVPEAKSALASLVKRSRKDPGIKVGVVSGRALSDLKKRVGVNVPILAGCHGLQVLCEGKVFTYPGIDSFLRELANVKSRMRRVASRFPGAFVEDKKFSIAIHFREVSSKGKTAIARLIKEEVAQYPKLTLQSGKCVREILPNVDWDKGKAVSFILRAIGFPEHGHIVYAGDDLTDENAFQEVNRRGGISIRVGRSASKSSAKFLVSSPRAIAQFLIATLNLYNNLP